MPQKIQGALMATKPADLVDERPGADSFAGLRLSVDEFLVLPDDGRKYELVDGVVIMSPRPTPRHQRTARAVLLQLAYFSEANPIGEVFYEIDVHLGKGESGAEVVYAPDIVFVRFDSKIDVSDVIAGAPDLVVEVVSRGSRRMDTVTKRNDYERFGVREYWLIDPARRSMSFFRLKDGEFVEIPPVGDRFASEAVPGFVLDVAAIRRTF